jgi:glycine betaine/proline transport system substrate-binding protein
LLSKINKVLKKNKFIWLIVTLLVFTLSLTGCSSNNQPAQTGDQAKGQEDTKPVVMFADISWDSVQVHNRIAAFILEHGYGYPCDFTFGESMPMIQGLANGDIDVIMEAWRNNFGEAWENFIADGSIVEVGVNYKDAPQGWYVPTYMIEGDPERGIEAVAPDLKSVFDLPKYKDLFKDPEVPSKGRFHNSTPGWAVTELNKEKIETYGLSDTYNVFSTGSDAAEIASMMEAYERGEPWLGYYWEPTWVMGKLDMTLLEEPPFDQETWDKNKGCAYLGETVTIGVSGSFNEEAPEVIEFLKEYSTTLEQNNNILAYMNDNDGDIEKAAIYFLEKYPDVWKSWLPQDIADKVEKALTEGDN